VEECGLALRDARLFRARLADAFDEAAARLLRELAADVLARELRLVPCELAAIVQRVQRTAPVVVVRVAAHDAAHITDVPVVVDETLEPGDAILEVVGGAVDARLGVRLAQVLEAFA
jgi:flagellar biosynthesis/type III secretory pathway protein FliH